MNIPLGGTFIHWVDQTEYLGVTLCSATKFKCNWNEAKRKFYSCSNTILGRLGTCNAIDAVLKLINATGTPKLMYSIVATALSKCDQNDLSFAYNSFFAKVFNLHEANSIKFC